MAFVSTPLLPHNSPLQVPGSLCPSHPFTAFSSPSRTRNVPFVMQAPLGGKGKKPSRNRKFRPGAGGAQAEKTKLEPETVFLETGPSNYELIVPTLSILTVVGIIPFVAAVARAAWVRYKFTSRRISISSGFQGKEQTEIIYRDIEKMKYVRRLGGAADCVITLKDGAKLEIRAVPNFDKVFEYVLGKVDEEAKEASGAA